MPDHCSPLNSPTPGLSRSRFFAALLLLFLCATSLRLYYIAHKTLVHVDESASITLSTYTAPGWSQHFDEGRVYTGDTLRKLSYTVKPGLAGLCEDLLNLRADNRDLPHTNLYYSLLRTALFGMTDWDTHSLMLRGCLLNLLIFSMIFVALYKLGHAIYGEDRRLLLVAMAAATLNPASLSSALLVRTYELQTLMLILVAWISIVYMQRMRKALPCPDYKQFFLHGSIVALCFLSGYFALFYVALLGLLLMAFAVTHAQKSYIIYLIFLVLLALIMAWAAFSPFMLGLFYDRGAEASQKLSLAYVLNNTGYILDKFTYLHGKHVTSVVGMLVLIAGAWFSRGQLQSIALQGQQEQHAQREQRAHARMVQGLLLMVMLWALLSFTLAPYKTLRYIMPAAPLALLLACIFFQHARHRTALAFVFLLSTVSLIFFPGSVEYYQGEERVPPSDAPYIVSLSIPWRTEAIVPYALDTQQVIFYNSCTSLRAQYQKHPGSLLLVDDAQFKQCHMENMPGLHKEREYTYFTAYTIHPTK